MSDQMAYFDGLIYPKLGMAWPLIVAFVVVYGGGSPDLILWGGLAGVIMVLFGQWSYHHPYWWWPTHAEDRVAAIQRAEQEWAMSENSPKTDKGD